MKYFKFLTLSLFLITFLRNNTEIEFQKKHSESTSFTKDSTYSSVVDAFLKKMEENYGKSFEKKIWNHHEEFRNNLINKEFDNFVFITSEKKKLDLKKYNIPIVIIATASWCAPCESLVPAINELSKKYENKVKFIMITHDVGEKAENYSSKFNNTVSVIPSLEKKNSMKPVKLEIGKFKHILTFPTIYFLNSEKKIVKIQTGASLPKSYLINGKIDAESLFDDNSEIETSQKKSLKTNFNLLKEGIEKSMK
jgi:thiol-disulfide isomerase/thioredoxin